MRISLNIDDDVLRAAKDLARRQKKTAGAVISELAREALTSAPPAAQKAMTIFGFRPFPNRGGIVNNEQVDRLRGQDIY